jgi:hypothetical protein
VRRFAVALVVPALLAGACGGAEPIVDDELTAQPYPDDDVDDRAEDDAEDGDEVVPVEDEGAEDAPESDVASEPEDSGPRASDAAAYLEQRLPDDALDHDVLLLEGTADDGRLLLAMVTADREAAVETARWSDGAFQQADVADAGPAEALGTLRTPETANGQQVVALGLHEDGELRVAVWELHDVELQVPGECPISEPREIRGQRADEVTIRCAAPDADEAQDLVWNEGAFVPPARAARTQGPDRDDERAAAGTADHDDEDAVAPASAGASTGRDAGQDDERERRTGPAARALERRSAAAGGRSDVRDSPRGAQGRGHHRR